MHGANGPAPPPPPRPRRPPPLPPRSPPQSSPAHDENTVSPMHAEEGRASSTAAGKTKRDHRTPANHADHDAKAAIPPPLYAPVTGQTTPAYHARQLESGDVPPDHAQHVHSAPIAPSAPSAPFSGTGGGIGPPDYSTSAQPAYASDSNLPTDAQHSVHPVVMTQDLLREDVLVGGVGPEMCGPNRASAPPPDYAGDSRFASGHRRRRSDSGENTAVKKEVRFMRWALFLLGNVISVSVLISDIAGLDVCFEKSLDLYMDDDSFAVTIAQANESATSTWLLIALIFGLWLDVASAIALSWIYRSPLDIKSVHKIPADDRRNCAGNVMIFFLAPFLWSVTYVFGGLANLYYGSNTLCEGSQGGKTMRLVLTIVGYIMLLVGALMGLASLIGLLFTPAKCSGVCCTKMREKVHRRVLSKGPLFDLFWQLQGVLWAYVGGSFTLFEAIFLGVTGVTGQILIWSGSFAPNMMRELLVRT